jgi:Tfp pilus assembly protein PilZ
MSDKRDSKRHRKRLHVRFGVDTVRCSSLTEDISPEGLFIQGSRLFKPGTLVQIDLTLNDDSRVSLEGQVMWAKRVPRGLSGRLAKGGMGIKITTIMEGADIYARLCEEMTCR